MTGTTCFHKGNWIIDLIPLGKDDDTELHIKITHRISEEEINIHIHDFINISNEITEYYENNF